MRRFTSGRRLGVEPGLEDHRCGHLVLLLAALLPLDPAPDHEALALDGGEPLVAVFDRPSGLRGEPGAEVSDPVGLLPFFSPRVKWQSRNDFFDVVSFEHLFYGRAVLGEGLPLDGAQRLGNQAQTVADGDSNPFVSHVQCG
jgi:hypothetical protein